MANQIIVAEPRATDANGNPVSGARAYPYQSGTTTPIAVYSDEALTILHATPIVADSGGFFPQIFYGGAFQPKVVVKDASDVTLWQRDPAPMIVSASSAAENISFSPIVNNAATNVQDAIEVNAAAAAAKVANTRTIGAGVGLTGGGDLSANRTLAIDEGDAAALTAGTDGKFPDAATIRADIDASVQLTLATMQTASGTAVTFTGIPAGTKEIELMFADLSMNGTDHILVQIGDAGGFETTGYASGSGDRSADSISTAGFIIRIGAAGDIADGVMHLRLMDAATFKWAASHAVTRPGTTVSGGGAKALSAELTQIRVVPSGADSFDGGTINISYR